MYETFFVRFAHLDIQVTIFILSYYLLLQFNYVRSCYWQRIDYFACIYILMKKLYAYAILLKVALCGKMISVLHPYDYCAILYVLSMQIIREKDIAYYYYITIYIIYLSLVI